MSNDSTMYYPTRRKLRIFSSDPLVKPFTDPVLTVDIPWEKLKPGPRTDWIEIVDSDPETGRTIDPIDLNLPYILAQDGLTPNEANLQFHQQMVYAVIMSTHERFVQALGRGVRLYKGKLIVRPHAERQARAYFDREKGEINFGYFRAKSDVHHNLPGGNIFTCLSHDVIARQATQAILYSLRPNYKRSKDDISISFLEAISDLVPILLRFNQPNFVEKALKNTNARLDTLDEIFMIGQQFAEALGMKGGIRPEIRSKPDPDALDKLKEPHARSAVLTAAILDAMIAVYQKRTEDLLRISNNQKELHSTYFPPDLLNRMAWEARKTAGHFLNICIRAIDYCPPVDCDFGDYLRAIITSDWDIVPDDTWNYRTALIHAFRSRGIYPRGVLSLSENSLLLQDPEIDFNSYFKGFPQLRFDWSTITGLPIDVEEEYKKFFQDILGKFSKLEQFGLKSGEPFSVESVQPLRRLSPDSRIANDVVVQIVYGGKAINDGTYPDSREKGCTLIINEQGKVRYCASSCKEENGDDILTALMKIESKRGSHRRESFALPEKRKLRIYAIDPLVTPFDDPVVTINVPWEPLKSGPVGKHIEVIDYDTAADRFYVPVELDDPFNLAQHGVKPSESNPKFHQQMVYAVVMATHSYFERALGRGVGLNGGLDEKHRRQPLRVFPHGILEPNAFFSPDLGALIFGYFRAAQDYGGRNLPGGNIFTCLSHDVIAHETAHCILHGLRPLFLQYTNEDVMALHEAFADLVAIFQRFSFPGFLEDAIQKSKARLDSTDTLFQMGRQFGEGLGLRKALRSAIGKEPDPIALSKTHECHERGAILLSAIFSAMVAVYQHRTQDLLRIATGGTGFLPPGHLSADLVGRLAKEARRTAGHFLNICIRAIDYCPPVDVDFGDYLRAMITADKDVVPDDTWNYRTALIDAFRKHGIYPKGVFSLAEDSLICDVPERLDTQENQFSKIRFDKAPQEAFTKNAESLYIDIFKRFIDTGKNKAELNLVENEEYEIESVQPLRRIGPNGQVLSDIVVQVKQKKDISANGQDSFTFYGGTTLIVNDQGEVRYSIFKRLDSESRLKRQKEYMRELGSWMLDVPDKGILKMLDFKTINRGW